MEEGGTSSEDSPDASAVGDTDENGDADDTNVGIWGARRAQGTAGARDTVSVDIWGSARAEKEDPLGLESVEPPTDLWGDGAKPRVSAGRAPGDNRPVRFVLPATWAATPKRKPGWILRRRRP
jgi:hypothetical protein